MEKSPIDCGREMHQTEQNQYSRRRPERRSVEIEFYDNVHRYTNGGSWGQQWISN